MLRRLAKTGSGAFTLIELLVVIVILGILMAVAVPTFLSQQGKAKDAKAKSYLEYAYRTAKADLIGGTSFPAGTSLISDIQQAEPELTVANSSCSSVSGSNTVAVSPRSTPQLVILCDRSDSGNIYALNATPSGATIGQPSAYAAAVQTTTPTGFWPLSETAGTTAADLSTGSHAGTYHAGYTLAQQGGLLGDATGVAFNGSSGYVSTGLTHANTFSGFTLEAWIKQATAPGSERWIEGFVGQSIQLNIEAGGAASIYLYNGHWSGIFSSQSVCDGKWHHVVGTWDGATLRIYVDGKLSNSGAVAGPATDSGGTFSIGTNFSQYFPGSVQDAAVYDRALSATEVAAHYSAGVGQ